MQCLGTELGNNFDGLAAGLLIIRELCGLGLHRHNGDVMGDDIVKVPGNIFALVTDRFFGTLA